MEDGSSTKQDPGGYADVEEKVVEKETEIYKCPNCGSNMNFSVKNQSLYCPYCETVVDFEKEQSTEFIDFYSQRAPDEDWGNDTHVYRCSNCGATEVVSKLDIAKVCSFCGTPNIVQTEELAGLKPNCVLPFKLTDNDARDFFSKWLKKKWFKPKNLLRDSKITKMNGVYSPTFSYNSDTISAYHIHYGEYYYVTVGSGENRHTERRVRYYSASGNFSKNFVDLMMEASPFLNQKDQNDLKPFNTSEAQQYDKKYLAGFVASSYDKGVEACFEDAKKVMHDVIYDGIVAKYNADVVVSLDIKTNYYKVTYRYMLLPIYISNFAFKQKNYRFLVNGTNGKVTGKVPRSAVKIGIFTLFLLAVGAGLLFLLKYYGVF